MREMRGMREQGRKDRKYRRIPLSPCPLFPYSLLPAPFFF
jgi:hypothetical protein